MKMCVWIFGATATTKAARKPANATKTATIDEKTTSEKP